MASILLPEIGKMREETQLMDEGVIRKECNIHMLLPQIWQHQDPRYFLVGRAVPDRGARCRSIVSGVFQVLATFAGRT